MTLVCSYPSRSAEATRGTMLHLVMIVGQIQVLSREGHEEEAVGPQTRAEYMMGTYWFLMWKHPQGVDRREGPPLYEWILLVIPVHSLLARSKYIRCEPKSSYLQPV